MHIYILHVLYYIILHILYLNEAFETLKFYATYEILTVHQNKLAHDNNKIFQGDFPISASVTPHYWRKYCTTHRKTFIAIKTEDGN